MGVRRETRGDDHSVRIVILAIGRLKAGSERELVERYRERAAGLVRSLGFVSIEAAEIPESRARRAADRIEEEGSALLARIPADAAVIVYDERGRSDSSSEVIADHIGKWRDAGRPALVVVIGGPDGLDASVRARADLILAFGAATLPHGLVRVLVLEQMYRTLTILAGHPYHRGSP